jgi:hypothetical protein
VLLLGQRQLRVAGVILENPLPSIPFMVRALYPQRWLPYHYLGPFVFDRWDAVGTLEAPTEKNEGSLGRIPSLWIRSGSDEIIPTGEKDGVKRMHEAWIQMGEGGEGQVEKRWIDVDGALHDTAFLQRKWRDEIGGFLKRVAG